MEKPTQEQIKKLWEWCGFQWKEGQSVNYKIWYSPQGKPMRLPSIDLNNLFKYAVLQVVRKLESRFDAKTNLIRGLEILFLKWIEKIREGYSIEDALFWVLYSVLVKENDD